MQPLRPDTQCLAWRIDCSNDLTVIIAVVEKSILLLSLSDTAKMADTQWRLGSYMNAEEAQRRAVEMTGSYERLRKGEVNDPRMVTLHRGLWDHSVETNELDPRIGNKIYAAVTV